MLNGEYTMKAKKWFILIGLLTLFSVLPLLGIRLASAVRQGMAVSDAERAARSLGGRFLGVGDIALQVTDSTCGPAALSFVLREHGLNVSESVLAEMSGTQSTGTTLLGLALAAETLGFTAEGLRVPDKHFGDIDLPAIVHMPNLNHFVVVTSREEGGVIIADPAYGYIQLPLRSFLKHWDGVVLVVRPT